MGDVVGGGVMILLEKVKTSLKIPAEERSLGKTSLMTRNKDRSVWHRGFYGTREARLCTATQEGVGVHVRREEPVDSNGVEGVKEGRKDL